jgi:hypothetical protein
MSPVQYSKTFWSTVELRIVFPHPGIPYSQRKDAGSDFHAV